MYACTKVLRSRRSLCAVRNDARALHGGDTRGGRVIAEFINRVFAFDVAGSWEWGHYGLGLGLGHAIVFGKTFACSQHKAVERRGRAEGAGLEFGVELNSEVKRVLGTWELSHLHTLVKLVLTSEVESIVFEICDAFRVHLVSVAVSLHDMVHTLIDEACNTLGLCNLLGESVKVGTAATETHSTSHLSLVVLEHLDDNLLLGLLVNLI
mmetsp:Transcript_385/g.878  ORF Transcript_385/g.878 Transcript_385/m.878 type:complete len:209 (+) Transcript_385:535-1161(+)